MCILQFHTQCVMLFRPCVEYLEKHKYEAQFHYIKWLQFHLIPTLLLSDSLPKELGLREELTHLHFHQTFFILRKKQSKEQVKHLSKMIQRKSLKSLKMHSRILSQKYDFQFWINLLIST